MSKYELSISTDYVPTWTLQDALRELFQNAIDQEAVCSDNAMKWDFNVANGTLAISNQTSKLNASTLLLGTSTKRGDSSTVGKFGEGYKLAALVLTRLGKKLTIYSGTETWNFRFSKSRKFNATILVCDITTDWRVWRQGDPTLSMVVEGLTLQDFAELQAVNLQVLPPKAFITSPKGRILLDERWRGKVFVNGLFIVDTNTTNSMGTYRCGYDLKPEFVELDRDRKLITDFNLQWIASEFWALAASREHNYQPGCHNDLTYKHMFIQMVEQDAPDVKFIKHFRVDELSTEVHTRFVDTHGSDAVPITYQHEMKAVLATGKTPVIVSESHKTLLCNAHDYAIPVYRTVRERLKTWFVMYGAELSDAATRELEEIIDDL